MLLLVPLLLTYPFLDSPPLAVAVEAADGCWGLVVTLLQFLLLLRTHLDGGFALHLSTAERFLRHRTAVLLRTHGQEIQLK